MEKSLRKSVNAPMTKFSPMFKDSDFIEVTEWTNGEGWDININDKHISLHYDELDAINYLINVLKYEKDGFTE